MVKLDIQWKTKTTPGRVAGVADGPGKDKSMGPMDSEEEREVRREDRGSPLVNQPQCHLM